MGKIKEFFNKHKRLCRLLVALVLFAAFFVGFCFGYTAQTVKEQGNGGTAAIRASAEEAKAEVEFPVNYCNTFLFKEQTVNGVRLSVDKNGIIYLSGTPTEKRFVFNCSYPSDYFDIFSELLDTSPFFYHSELSGVVFEFCLVIDGENCYYPRTVAPNAKLPTGDLSAITMYLIIERPEMEPFNNDAYYLSLYKNANSNFYTPSLLGYYDMAYNEGKQDGYEEGKKAGYTEGYEKGKADGYEEGFAAGYNDGYGQAVETLATGLLTKGNASYINMSLAPSGSGITCKAYSDYFTYSFAATYNGMLQLKCDRSFHNGYKLKIKVKSVTVETVFSVWILDLETSSSAMYEVFRLPVSEEKAYEVVVNVPVSVSTGFGSFVITPATLSSGGVVKGLEIEVVGSEKNYYDNGYDNGYAEGQKFGYDSGYTKGYALGQAEWYEKGMNEGYDKGYNVGLEEGITQPMTSSVGSFFQSIYSIFDLNIFGPIKIGHFIFIPLVLSLLLLILKLFRG